MLKIDLNPYYNGLDLERNSYNIIDIYINLGKQVFLNEICKIKDLFEKCNNREN